MCVNSRVEEINRLLMSLLHIKCSKKYNVNCCWRWMITSSLCVARFHLNSGNSYLNRSNRSILIFIKGRSTVFLQLIDTQRRLWSDMWLLVWHQNAELKSWRYQIQIGWSVCKAHIFSPRASYHLNCPLYSCSNLFFLWLFVLSQRCPMQPWRTTSYFMLGITVDVD